MRALFYSQTKTVTLAAFLIGISTLVSGLLGLLRDRLLAGNFGAGPELDIYFAAFRIPDFIYGILIMGGLSAVFLPVFSEYFQKSKEEVWRVIGNILNVFLFLLVFLCGVLFFLTPWLLDLIAPGFDPEQKNLAVSLTRIMFLSPIFFGLSSIFSGVLHYFNRFLAYSFAPIIYNLGIIIGILFFVPIFDLKGLAYGVVLGAFLHWIIQIPAAKASGFKYFPAFNIAWPSLRKIFKLMIPRTIGSAAYQLNLIVITAIASTLAAGSIAVFNFAHHLHYFPIGLIGASFAIAAFPTLSRAWVNGFREEFLGNFSSTFRQILFLIVPGSVLIFLLRAQIVRLILGTGQFDWAATQLTAASLGLFCFGMFAFTFIPFLSRVFYSFQDTKTPTIAGISSMVLNIVLAFLLVWALGFSNFFEAFIRASLKLKGIEDIAVVGLPLALVAAGAFQFLLLLFFLKKKMGDIKLREIWQSFWKTALASLLMALVAYSVLQLVADFVDMKTFFGVFVQTLSSAFAGLLTYLFFAHIFRSFEIKNIKFLIFKK